MGRRSSLKSRVENLEQEVAALKSRAEGKTSDPWWVELFGVFKNDPLFDEAVKAGAAYRESLRPKRRKKKSGKYVPSRHRPREKAPG